MAKGFRSNQNSHGVVAHQGINAHQGEVLFNSLSDQQPIKRVFMRNRQLIQAPDVGPLDWQQQPTLLFNNPPMDVRQRKVEIQLAELHLDLDLPEVHDAAANLVFRVCDAACSSDGKAGWLCQPPDQHTGIKKEAVAAQGIRNSSARGASKSAWVRILPSKPPGCREGVAAARVADSSRAARRAPTWLRSSALRHSSWRCSDGLMEVMPNRRSANLNFRWVELLIQHLVRQPGSATSRPALPGHPGRHGRPSRLNASMSPGSKTWGLRLSRSARIAASCSSIERSAWADGSGGAGSSSLGRIGWVPYGERSAYVSPETLIEREVMHG